MAYIERHAGKTVAELARMFGAVLVTGARQTGKTTLLEHITPDIAHLTLDEAATLQAARESGSLFFAYNPPPVFVDEIQKAPELFPEMKRIIDGTKAKGLLYLSGSQQFRMMKNVSESLAGRIGIVTLAGLSLREKYGVALDEPFLPSAAHLQKRVGANAPPDLSPARLWEHIHRGNMPALTENPNANWSRYYGAYVSTYIERDVRDFYDIAKPIQFFDFLSLVAAHTGSLLNYSELARGVGIDMKTAQTWIGVLERSGLVYLLRPYSPNLSKRIVKSPKLYFLDTGLCAYLTRWLTPESLMAGAMAGPMLETYAVGEILKSYLHNGRTPLIYHYRDQQKNEVDVVIEQDGTLYPVEIKKTANPGKNDFKAFARLADLGKERGLGAVLCLQPERVALSRDVVSMPVWSV